MTKVSAGWRMAALFCAGLAFGVVVTIKYISPPSQDIKIGKITIKGRNNTVTDALDISKADTQDNSEDNSEDKSKVKTRIKNRELRRQLRKDNK
jgi:hypothetical protein